MENSNNANGENLKAGSEENKKKIKQYSIDIKGHKFSVASPYGGEHIKTVESLINQKMNEVEDITKVNNKLSLALLTALNLADELLSVKKNATGFNEDYIERIEILVDKLDTAIDKAL